MLSFKFCGGVAPRGGGACPPCSIDEDCISEPPRGRRLALLAPGSPPAPVPCPAAAAASSAAARAAGDIWPEAPARGCPPPGAFGAPPAKAARGCGDSGFGSAAGRIARLQSRESCPGRMGLMSRL